MTPVVLLRWRGSLVAMTFEPDRDEQGRALPARWEIAWARTWHEGTLDPVAWLCTSEHPTPEHLRAALEPLAEQVAEEIANRPPRRTAWAEA